MKFKLLFFLVLGTFFYIPLNAQNSVKSGIISGSVIDKTSKLPIEYASISLLNNDKVITGTITDANGNFSLNNLELKNYKVEIQFIGFKKQIISASLNESNKVLKLKTIALELEATMLEGVEIVAERSNMVQKIDRKVFNVGKDLIASGTSASEILNNVPTVSIDPQTKELSMRGNSNVRVLIDGKPSNIDAAQLLQQIPSSSIKQIELITNPSAKYNPEGMSGIINIILHKNAQTGFNGSINNGVTFGITPKVNSALNMNYKVGKVNFYTNYGINHGINANHGFVYSENPTFENYQRFEFDNKNTSHLLKSGIDYYINDNNTLSIFTNQNIVDVSGNSLTSIDFFDNTTNNPNNNNQPNQDTEQRNFPKTSNKTQTYDLDYKHNFEKKGENIEFQINYSNTKNKENSLFQNTVFNPDSTTSRTNIINGETNYAQFNLDYINPINETTKLELGAESRLQHIQNEFDNISSSFLAANNFDFRRNIHAVYSNYGKKWDKWSAQLGFRLEHYSIEAEFERNETNPDFYSKQLVKDNIFTVYPSTFLTYTLDDKNSFSLNYSRRVDRPSIGQINPIREWTTPLLESRGNPSLVPQFTNSFEFSYTKNTKLGSITSGVFYRQINNEISRVILNNPNSVNQKILSFDNFDNNNAYGIESSANLKFYKWWSVNASADAYFKQIKGTVQNVTTGNPELTKVDITTFNTRINNSFVANKNLRFQLFGMFRGRERGLQFTRSEMYKVDFGSTYNVLNGKGTITARYNDIFKTMHFEFDGKIPYNQSGAFYWESQTFYIGFNYVFGGGKNKALQRKQRDANETQGGGGMF